jgi:hypothetical protein
MDQFQLGSIPHPVEETLERYVMKTCTPKEIEDIEDHLFVCEHCQKRLGPIEEWVSLMKVALPMGPRELPATPLWRRPIAWIPLARLRSAPLGLAMAGAAVLLALSPFWLRDRPSSYGAVQTVVLSANRGGASDTMFTAKAGSLIKLQFPAADLIGPLELAVVDGTGAPVFSTRLQNAGDTVPLPAKLNPGVYWVRLNRIEDHQLLRETGLRVIK